MLPIHRIFATVAWVAVSLSLMSAQSLSELSSPKDIPSGSVVVVGFLGGYDRWNDPHRGVRKVVLRLRSRGMFAEAIGNHSYRTALDFLHRALDTNHDSRIDSKEASAARVILFGQSWGGAAAIKMARSLEQDRVPVLLTVQVDSVGLHDAVIPANVHAALNLFQHESFTIRGRRVIRAADPASTQILGNFQFRYPPGSIDESDASWKRRVIGRSHTMMELDPRVWDDVEQHIVVAATK